MSDQNFFNGHLLSGGHGNRISFRSPRNKFSLTQRAILLNSKDKSLESLPLRFSRKIPAEKKKVDVPEKKVCEKTKNPVSHRKLNS